MIALLGALAQAAPAAPARNAAAGTIEPHRPDSGTVTAFTLRNGLRVVVEPDRRVPIVTVLVSYDVGAKDEAPGQFGYAHLFEHLLLDGSAHWDQSALRSLAELGAAQVNATTTQDRTILYETVPRAALERTLFLEADRMGHLAEALTPAKVTRETGVVLNEMHQRGTGYGEDWARIYADLYPADHPYHHSAIGSEADLRAVTVTDAQRWSRTYYSPNNAALILTGDIDAEAARALVERYFGALDPAAPVDRLRTRVVPLPGPVRRETYRAVPSSRIYATYIAPPAGSAAIADLDLRRRSSATASAPACIAGW